MATPTSTLLGGAQGSSMGTSWRFLLKHVPTGTDFWFDMGISHVRSCLCPGYNSDKTESETRIFQCIHQQPKSCMSTSNPTPQCLAWNPTLYPKALLPTR